MWVMLGKSISECPTSFLPASRSWIPIPESGIQQFAFGGKRSGSGCPAPPYSKRFSAQLLANQYSIPLLLASGRLLKINFDNFRNCFSICSCEAFSLIFS